MTDEELGANNEDRAEIERAGGGVIGGVVVSFSSSLIRIGTEDKEGCNTRSVSLEGV